MIFDHICFSVLSNDKKETRKKKLSRLYVSSLASLAEVGDGSIKYKKEDR